MNKQTNPHSYPEQPTILGEDTSRRTEYAKEFRRSDGSHLIVLYPDAVHYRKNGRWLNIDNRLSADTDEDGMPIYRNRGGAMQIHLPLRFSPGQPITLTHQGYQLRYRLEGDFPAVEGQKRQRRRNLTHPGSTYTNNYGPFGLLSSFQVGQRTLSTHEYDTAGRTFNLTKSTYGNGAYVQYTYDSHDRITGIRYNGDTSDRYTFKYDNCGALAEVCDVQLDICTRTFYDFAGRPIKLVQTKISNPSYQWHAYRYEYDEFGRLARFIEDAGNLSDMTTSYTFDLDGRITQQVYHAFKYTWAYDAYGRVTNRKNYYNNTLVLTTSFTYFDPDASHTTAMPASCTQTSASGYAKTFTFEYDDNGNIAVIEEVNGNRIRCAYNELNQLLRVDDAIYTYVSQYYQYDAAGNIVNIDECSVAFTPEMPLDYWNGGRYEYQDSLGWGDLATSFNMRNHTHDAIGNLLSDGTWTYTWEGGKRLKTMSKADTALQFGYDSHGRRVTKTVDNVQTHYDWVGNKLSCLWNDTDELFFRYDANGLPASLTYQGNDYFYLVNLQGDVMGIMDTAGNLVVEYQYDVWGALFFTDGSMADTLGKKNPLRYRGYCYDEETQLYYLINRYYSPAMKRFISPDSYPVSSSSLTGANMFTYCDNNPISRRDANGTSWDAAWEYHKLRQEYAQMGIPYPETPKGQTSRNNNGSSTIANYVAKTHVTTPGVGYRPGAFWGKIEFSSTVNHEAQKPALFNSYSDISADLSSFAGGVGISDWLGLGGGYSTDGNIFAEIQLTPWLHGQVSIGLDGIGITAGYDSGNMAYDLEIKGGWGGLAAAALTWNAILLLLAGGGAVPVFEQPKPAYGR